MKIVTTLIIALIAILLYGIYDIRGETNGIYIGVFFVFGYLIVILIVLLGILYAIRDWSVAIRTLFTISYLGLVISPLFLKG